jgi:hypothetical protein
LAGRQLAVAVEPDNRGVAVLNVPEIGTQTTLAVYDPDEQTQTVSAERAVREGLARVVIAWLNGVHKAEGKQAHHRGFDPLAKDVLQAAKRWRTAKLKPEDVIAVCEHRIAGWKAVTRDWLNNCTPRTLFRPSGFDAALEEVRSGFRPAQMTATPREERRFSPNRHTTLGSLPPRRAEEFADVE